MPPKAIASKTPSAPSATPTEERRALLRDYFRACLRVGGIDTLPETFAADLKATAAELGLLAYTRGLYDGAMRLLDLGKKALRVGKRAS